MSEQTASNKPTDPILCKMGCGFFGNPATDGCCSKCWRETLTTKSAVAEAQVCAPVPNSSTKKAEDPAPAPPEVDTKVTDEVMTDAVASETPKASGEAEAASKVEEVPLNTETPAVGIATTTPKAPEPAKKKKKKKKMNYKSMMASMMTQSPAKDNKDDKAKKEEDAIRKVTGGGAFSKIDKI